MGPFECGSRFPVVVNPANTNNMLSLAQKALNVFRCRRNILS